MALTVNGTVVNVPGEQIPAGYTKPTVITFQDFQYSRRMSLTVDKASVDDADALVTFAAIVTAVTTQVTNELADFDATNNVEAYAVMTNVANNLTVAQALYTNTAEAYVVSVTAFVKVT